MTKLTREFCVKVPPPEKGNKLYRGNDPKGLALRVTASGHRAFVFCYSAPSGRERRMTIGRFGDWTVGAAKKRALELRRQVDLGTDPLARKERIRREPSLRDLWRWYSQGDLQKLSARTRSDIEQSWRRLIEPILGPHTLAKDLRRVDVQEMLDKLTVSAGPYAANRCHSFLRRILNLAVAEGLLGENVATRAIRRNREQPRERYLAPNEIGRLLSALDTSQSIASARAIKLLIFTGARRSEVLGMRWSEIDLSVGVWTKAPARTKQRRVHRVPLSKAAIEVLKQQREISGGSEFVFPSSSARGHLTDIKRAWAHACSQAELQECRLHDLRHSFASILASEGRSLGVIGAMLGHSQSQTTLRYAHLFDDPLREAAELVATTTSAFRN